MMRLIALFVVLASPALASAQRGGVPVDSVTPAGLERIEVNVPEREQNGVQLFFAPHGQTRAEVRIDVLVAPSHREATEAMRFFEETAAGELPNVTGLGDEARGDAGIVALVRDNVFVVVRRIGGGHDALAIARVLDLVIEAVPRSAPGSPVRLAIPELVQGVQLLQLPEGVLEAHVVAGGSASARRTGRGWVLTRHGSEPFTVSVVACDRMLRRIRAQR